MAVPSGKEGLVEAPAGVEASTPVSATDVVAALGRVVDSPQFRRAPRSRDFLAYVVTETLAGRGERLSERTVARRALGREADFDGRDDASVRVRAGRVRKCLDDYYAGPGRDDAVRIVLPRGRYIPRFEPGPQEPYRGARVPGVAVMELEWGGDAQAGPLARSLSETLVQDLSRHRDIRTLGPISPPADAGRAAAAAGVTSVLTGRVVVSGQQVRLMARLVDAATAEVLWTSEEVVDLAEVTSFESGGAWPRQVASQLGDATGLVVREELRRGRVAGREPELAARLAFYSYVDRATESSITEAVRLVDAALAAGPRTATLLAMRGALANAASVHGLGDRAAELDRAETLAREALALDGANAHAHLVLGFAARERGHWDVAISHAEKAAALTPYRPSYLVGAGITLSGAGQWQRGSELIREAHRLHPGLSGHTHSMLAMSHLVEGDYARALAEASVLPSEGGYIWGPLYRAMAFSGLGYHEHAEAEVAKVRAVRPEVLDDLAGYLSSRMRLTEEQLSRLVGLVEAPRQGVK